MKIIRPGSQTNKYMTWQHLRKLFICLATFTFTTLLPSSRVESQNISTSATFCDKRTLTAQNTWTSDPLDDIYFYKCTTTTDYYSDNSTIPTSKTTCTQSRKKAYDKYAREWVVSVEQESCNKSSKKETSVTPLPNWHPPLVMGI